MDDFSETYKYIDPTGVFATKKRQELNEKFSVSHTYYPHAWHKSLDSLRGDEKVLCLGIDTSLYAKGLANMLGEASEIFLVDFNPVRMLENQNVFSDDLRFHFHEALLWNLPFKDKYFDVVICTYTLHRIGKPKNNKQISKDEARSNVNKTILEINRVLKNDGKSLIATHAKSSFSEILNCYQQIAKELDLSEQANAEFNHFEGFPQETAEDVLKNVFAKVEFDEIDTSLEFNDIKYFMEYWDCFPFPLFGENYISEDLRQKVRQRVVYHFQKELDENNILKISKPSGVFICQKF